MRPENDKKIMKDIGDLYKTDDFAYHLNEKIKIFFHNKKEKTNTEILGFIKEFNPYYQEDKYKFKRDAYILEDLNFQYDLNNDDEDYKKEHASFIINFHTLDYEDIFKDNMVKFLELMVNKIKDISSFDTTIDLIRVDEIGKSVTEYIQKLKNKYEILIKQEVEKLSGNKLKRPTEIIAKFEKLIFEQENNIDLKDNINKLRIRYLIYNELIKICNEDKYKITYKKDTVGSIEENLTVIEFDMHAQITILLRNGYKILSVRLLEKPAEENVEDGEAR